MITFKLFNAGIVEKMISKNLLKNFLSLFIIIGLSLSFSQAEPPTTATWNGGSGFWHNENNWTPSVIPNNSVTGTYSVEIDGSKPVTSNVTFKVSAPPITISKLKIDQGDTLTQEESTVLNIGEGEVINNGAWNVISRQEAIMGLLSDTILTGTGVLDLRESASFLISSQCYTLTIGPGQTILGGGNMGADCGLIVNRGTTLHAGDEPFIINAAYGIFNGGIISSTGMGGITLTNGIVSNTGSIEAGDGSLVNLENTRILGGILASHGSGKLLFSYNTFLENITLIGNAFVPISSTITVTNVLTDTGQMVLTPTSPLSQGPTLVFGNGAVITHTGQIVMGDSPFYTGTVPITDTTPFPRILTSGVFSQGPFHTIRGGGELLGNTGGMINQGAIVADGASPLVIDPGVDGFYNSGPLTVTSPAGLIMTDGLFVNSVIVTTTSPYPGGGFLSKSPPVGSVHVGEGSKAVFQDVQVLGGNFNTQGSGKLVFTHNTFLDNVWITGTSIISGTSSITYSVALTHTGETHLTCSVGVPAPAITFTDGTVLTGSGTIFMIGHPAYAINTTGIFTQTIPHSISGGGKILNGSGGMRNKGTIIAQGDNALVITPDERGFINSGNLHSNGPGGLSILNAHFFENQGIVEIGQNSFIDIVPAYTQTYGATIMNDGGSLNLGDGMGYMYLGGGELKGRGTILGSINNQGGAISPGLSTGCLSIVGVLTNTGELVMEIGGRDSCDEFDSVFVNGMVAFGGTLNLKFTDGFAPNLTDTFPIIYYLSHTLEFDDFEVSGLPGNRGAYLEYGESQLEVKIQEKENIAPQMQILEPSGMNEISTTTLVIRWTDEDPDDNALISLSYLEGITATIGTTIIGDLSEDDEADFYVWDTTTVPEGIYWIHAEISDGDNSPWMAFSPGSVKVTHVTQKELVNHLISLETFPQPRHTFADFNNDGYIDVADLVALCRIWGQSP